MSGHTISHLMGKAFFFYYKHDLIKLVFFLGWQCFETFRMAYHVLHLPSDVLYEMQDYLPWPDRLRLQKVCRDFSHTFRRGVEFWRTLRLSKADSPPSLFTVSVWQSVFRYCRMLRKFSARVPGPCPAAQNKGALILPRKSVAWLYLLLQKNWMSLESVQIEVCCSHCAKLLRIPPPDHKNWHVRVIGEPHP